MGIIAFIILGLLAGAIAKAIMPGDDPGGFIVTAIIGVVGALLGGFVAAALFDAHPLDEFFDISTWLTAIVGAIALLVIYRLVVDRGGDDQLVRLGLGDDRLEAFAHRVRGSDVRAAQDIRDVGLLGRGPVRLDVVDGRR